MLSALFRRQGLRQGLGHFSFSRPLMSTSAGKEGERFKLLFCGRTMADAYHFTRSKLDEKSFDVVWCERADVASEMTDADMLVPLMTRIDADLLSRAARLKYILQFGVGLEGVDVAAAKRAGVRVANIPSDNTFNAVSCAEMVVYLVLAGLRDQNRMTAAFRSRELGTPTGRVLHGANVLIVGFGAIARETVPRLQAFGCSVSAVRRSPWAHPVDPAANPAEAKLRRRGQQEEMLDLVREADIVVLTCTLNPSTRGMVNDEFFAAMKPRALLINVARGGLLDYESTRRALEGGRLGGIATDVMWEEPFPPEDPVAQHPKVIVTPHVAGVTEPSYQTMSDIVAEEAMALREGRPPGKRVNVQ